uniref:hypothetical protein n=1 Tax=Ramlibacter montanisoli TaxID=2732512 RepID=UPI00209C4DC5|nr:hypothetical protein [Ramlibacter montanisoli]
MQVLGEDHHAFYLEWMPLLDDADAFAQLCDVVHEVARAAVLQDDGEEESGPGGFGADVAAHDSHATPPAFAGCHSF